MRLLLWLLLFGGVCSLIAALKRRSCLAWFLLGTIFHVFALGILLLLPTLAIRLEESGRNTGQVNCPYCNNLIRLDAIRCPHCGGDVRPIEADTIMEE